MPSPPVAAPAVVVPAVPKAAAPIEPTPAMPGDGVPRGPRPPVLHIPQPTVKRGHGTLGVLLALLVLGGGAAAAYYYRPRPAAPKVPDTPTMKSPARPAARAFPATRPSTERRAPPVPQPAPPARPDDQTAAPNHPIVEIKPSAPRGRRSISSGWFEGAEGLGRAKKEQEYAGVPMIIYFRVDWCPYCQRMDQDIITSSSVREFLANVVKVRINPESSTESGEITRGMGVTGYPSVFVVPHPGSNPQKIPSLSRKANEPLELSAEKFINAAKEAGIRQAQNQVVDGFDKLNRGDTAGARADLDRAIEMNPGNADAYFWRGEADARAGELGRAVGNLKRALEIAPDRKDALFSLARIYGGNREYDEAIKYLTRAIRVDPDYAQGTAFAQRGQSYKMKGDLEAARADFAEACRRGTRSACVP